MSLLSAFDLQRCKDFMPFSRPEILSIPAGSRSDYDAFTKHMLAGGWLEHLKRYPVAARLIAVFCEQQSSFLAKALKDMEKDLLPIRETFNGGKETGKVTIIESGISDQHNGGKSVIKYEFEHGLKLLYKPRSSMIDLLWEKTLGWCRSKLPEFDFKTPVHFEGENCCWAENIENSSLAAKKDAAGFYYRAGGILALIYALGGTDFHQENLIACGAYPVLIDLETVLRPLVKPFAYEELTDEQKQSWLSLEGDSVIRTCLVPMWTPVSKDVSRDYGALTPDDNSAYSTREWLDINTDRMRRGLVDRKTNPSPNTAHFNGELMIVLDFKKELIKGFCDVYGMISDNRSEFTGGNGPVRHFSETTMRFLPRNSQVYADMIDRLRSPSLLRSGAAFSVEVEGLSKSFLNGVPAKDLEKLWKIFDAERRSLLFLNIPLFEFNASSDRIFDHTGEICPDYYLKTAIE
jgi:type 2 lantibiotic biosynthesis protein LanM